VGRRGGKGISACKVAVVFALLCPLVHLPPGERAFVEFLSVDRDEAASRLRMIRAMLDALGEAYEPRGDQIELRSRPVIFRVTTASVRGVVGRTTILIVADEGARWRDADTGANPAREILGSLAPSMATQPNARALFLSAPWSEHDHHAERFAHGETDHQTVAYAPTWVANPTLTEEDTRALEPDARVWSREYLARPVEAVSAIATAEELAAVTTKLARRPIPDERRCAYFLDVGQRRDRTALVRAWLEPREVAPGRRVEALVLDVVAHLVPTLLRRTSIDDVVRAVVDAHRECRGPVYADPHYLDAWAPRARELGVTCVELPMTSGAITARVEALQARIIARSIDLPAHPELQRELAQAQLITHAKNRRTLTAPVRRGAHDDIVACIVLAHESAAKIPIVSTGEVVVRRTPLFWDAESRELVGGERRYVRRATGAPCEPPRSDSGFLRWALDTMSAGYRTPALNAFLAEQGLDVTKHIEPEDVPAFAELLGPRLSVRVHH
jgi:hypothetical protein